jgi:hypothetical protein
MWFQTFIINNIIIIIMSSGYSNSISISISGGGGGGGGGNSFSLKRVLHFNTDSGYGIFVFMVYPRNSKTTVDYTVWMVR